MRLGNTGRLLAALMLAVIILTGIWLYIQRIEETPTPIPSPTSTPQPTGKPKTEDVISVPHIYHKPENWNSKAIVFVHGLGRSKEVWTGDMEAFERLGYSTFSFDLPFHGSRGSFSGSEQLPTLIRQASDEIIVIAEFLRGEGASEVYLVSRSLGSIVSAIALGRGARIEKAVLLLPAANLQYVFTYGEIGEWPSWLNDYETLREIDPLYLLPNYTGRIHFHCGRRDNILTPEAGVFAYNAAILARERKIFWHNQTHSMPLSEYFENAKQLFESAEPSLKVSDLVMNVQIPPSGGNGVCDEDETWKSSPFDCKREVLIIGFQLHIEEVVEGKYYDSSRELFEKYAETLDKLAAVFEKHGAKISIQTEKNFAIADVKYGRNILRELEERGHGIGAQSHMGHHIRELNLNTDQKKLQYTAEVKRIVENALGHPVTNIGGGFEMENINLLGSMEGGLGFTSMTAVEKPYNARTGRPPRWLHPWILPPTSMTDLSNPEWMAHSPEGSIVYIPGWYTSETFEIDYLKNPTCFDKASQSLQKALQNVDGRFINVWWFSSHLYQCGRNPADVQRVLDAYDKWLTEVIDPLVKEGKVVWMTFDEIAQIYLKWEKERYIYITQHATGKINQKISPANPTHKAILSILAQTCQIEAYTPEGPSTNTRDSKRDPEEVRVASIHIPGVIEKAAPK